MTPSARHLAALALALVPLAPVGGAETARAARHGEALASPKESFERLKALAGTWEGKAGDGERLGPATVRWEVISAGTAVMETLFPGTEHEMRSVYFMDGDELVLTHYCAMGNQPRMRLSRASARGDLVFDFAGGTNLDPAKDVHVHGGRIRLLGGDALEAEWTVWAGGKPAGANRFVLARKAG